MKAKKEENKLPLAPDQLDLYCELMKKHNLGKLKVENDEISISLSFQSAARYEQISPAPQPVSSPVVATKKGAAAAGTVTSPVVGTVYLSPQPTSPAFVKEGDKVKEGDTLLIVESMKIMNQIHAPTSGTVKKIFVSNEQPVEFDDELMLIE